ncbi:MAG: Serine/threonine-protein phosphatase 2A activator 1 [Claussenomyces sp. TS43310]|nr:MAG: Serine/threonine-protein phosphatase 2A activator 1 [Claussenomyces sp. TS43310]
MTSRSLQVLDSSVPHGFIKPVKKINDGNDVTRFLRSRAYVDIGTFVMQLNTAMCPSRTVDHDRKDFTRWDLGSTIAEPDSVKRVRSMLKAVESIVDEASPDTGPRRFGNVSFRKWYYLLESRVSTLFKEYLPLETLGRTSSEEASAEDELTSYLLGSFGSPQRLDYGSGHELSFLAFLGCLWKLGVFQNHAEDLQNGDLERSIVLGIIEPYLNVVRHLILAYTLEPAGSHGVWGLDDHFFLPYIFGSAQLCPAIESGDRTPIEGSLPGAPDPADVTKKRVVEKQRKQNMYFSAVGFIYDVKTGPFWEHSPILFDISGIRSGWGKINKGMIKMYDAEVLSKFPVVQHFPFGSLFSWDHDPNAPAPSESVHTANQPSAGQNISVTGNTTGISTSRSLPFQATTAPWIRTPSAADVPSGNAMPSTRTPWRPDHASSSSPSADGSTRAPWAKLPERGAPVP